MNSIEKENLRFQKLTPNFTLNELIRSRKAEELGIENFPNEEQRANLTALCKNVLQPLRNHIGKALLVSSGYRCPRLNQLVGGVKGSQHTKGEAADLMIPSIREAMNWIRWMQEHLQFDQLILERDSTGYHWIHVSYHVGKNRQQVLYLKKT